MDPYNKCRVWTKQTKQYYSKPSDLRNMECYPTPPINVDTYHTPTSNMGRHFTPPIHIDTYHTPTSNMGGHSTPPINVDTYHTPTSNTTSYPTPPINVDMFHTPTSNVGRHSTPPNKMDRYPTLPKTDKGKEVTKPKRTYKMDILPHNPHGTPDIIFTQSPYSNIYTQSHDVTCGCSQHDDIINSCNCSRYNDVIKPCAHDPTKSDLVTPGSGSGDGLRSGHVEDQLRNKEESYMALAIVVSVCFNLPFGLIALLTSWSAMTSFKIKDTNKAKLKARLSLALSMLGILATLVTMGVVVMYVASKK